MAKKIQQKQVENLYEDFVQINTDIENLNSLRIGRNLLKNSTDYSENWVNKGPVTLTDDFFLRSRVYKTTKGWQAMAYKISAIANLDYSKTFTLSFYAKAGGDTSANTGALYLYGKFTSSKKITNIKSLTTEWRRFSVVIKFSESSTDTTIRVEPQSSITEGLFFSAFKLEEGDKLTDYSIAPEDYLVRNDVKIIEQKIYKLSSITTYNGSFFEDSFFFAKNGNQVNIHFEVQMDEQDFSNGNVKLFDLPDDTVPNTQVFNSIVMLGKDNTLVLSSIDIDNIAKAVYLSGYKPVIGQPLYISLFWAIK